MRADVAVRALLAMLCAGLLAAPARGQQLPDLAAQSALPINLEAASSEFDRRNNRLVFQRLHITQGTLSITAEVGEAARLDFENTQWLFKGNVVIENLGARAFSDDADLTFVGHQLRTATLRGSPARFEQDRPAAATLKGRAGTMDYDVAGAIIRLNQNAWLSDGANEFTGERIAYDLRRQYVTADSRGGGPVIIKINPPPRDQKSGKTP